MIRIEVIDRGFGNMAQQFRAIGDVVPEAMEHAVEEALPMIETEVVADFERGGRPPGGPWDRNAAATIKRKGFDKPLWETGEMSRGFQFPVERPDDQTVEVWVTNTKKNKGKNIWHIHYTGYPNKRTGRDVVARPSGTLADAAASKVADKIQEQFMEAVDEVLSTA